MQPSITSLSEQRLERLGRVALLRPTESYSNNIRDTFRSLQKGKPDFYWEGAWYVDDEPKDDIALF